MRTINRSLGAHLDTSTRQEMKVVAKNPLHMHKELFVRYLELRSKQLRRDSGTQEEYESRFEAELVPLTAKWKEVAKSRKRAR